MKENIMKVVRGFTSLPIILEREKAYYTLTVNYKRLVDKGYKAREYLTPASEEYIEELLSEVKKITSFNFTVHFDRGVDWSKPEPEQFSDTWRDVQFIFFSGHTKDDGVPNLKNKKKYGAFDFNTSGARESFRISEKLSRPNWKDPDDHARPIEGNYFEYDKVQTLILQLIALDQILDRQQEEKNNIINTLRLE